VSSNKPSARVVEGQKYVLRSIEGFAGAPRLVGVIDPDAFAEEMIEGEHFNRGIDPARLSTIFANLEQTITALHARRECVRAGHDEPGRSAAARECAPRPACRSRRAP
jgi:hypothetical protein